ncbi:MAG: rRNA cytosine-C5-methylase [Flavobacteriales bacterium]|nr:rRNA cytosine-C5-methylase [Flavobacteriales bacterium]MBK7940699.1 rRNA cytosine-C5-methylase [Flavobacteriales bacterium]MBK9700884.1 rRNA cytosine-C5-methylase [Flavobacteriales bacterium]
MRRPRKARDVGAMPPLPTGLIERLSATLGNEAPALLAALDRPPSTSIRLNRLKPGGPTGEPVPWCTTGRYLDERPLFTVDPLLHAGAYYVQEAGSMLIERAMAAAGLIGADALALDLCAAPGGKSTHLLSLLGPGAVVVCNELDGRRQAVLQENVWKWGSPNACVTRLPAEAFGTLPHFDLVLLDAPCSGEGLMRREPVARAQWSLELVRQCSAVQAGLLHHAWGALRPGGVLIYSTCTWADEEDEGQLHRFLQQHEAEVLTIDPLDSGPVRGELGLTCMPHRCRAEGFFIAAVRKPGRSSSPPDAGPCSADGHLLRPPGWAAVTAALRAAIDRSGGALPLTMAVPGGTAPHPAAACCPEAVDLLRSVLPFTTVDLDRDGALAFLRGEAIASTGARGHALMCHAGLGLGWAKGAGNRWNNRHPAGWRIRTRRNGV